MIVTADINLRKVVCQSVTRVSREPTTKCYLTVRLFDRIGYTSLFDSKFPIVIYESFTFVKTFPCDGLIKLSELLAREPIVISLLQTKYDSTKENDPLIEDPHLAVISNKKPPEGQILAQYSGMAFNFLFPKPTIRPPVPGSKEYAVRPVLLDTSEFTSIFKVKPELLFCTHVVVKEDSDPSLEHNLAPTREQLINKLIMAQIDHGIGIQDKELGIGSVTGPGTGLDSTAPPNHQNVQSCVKRVQKVKKKCYMCELRRNYYFNSEAATAGGQKPYTGEDIQVSELFDKELLKNGKIQDISMPCHNGLDMNGHNHNLVPLTNGNDEGAEADDEEDEEDGSKKGRS